MGKEDKKCEDSKAEKKCCAISSCGPGFIAERMAGCCGGWAQDKVLDPSDVMAKCRAGVGEAAECCPTTDGKK